MIFKPAEWLGDFPFEPPSQTLVGDFVFGQDWPGQGKASPGQLVCAATGSTVTIKEIHTRVEALARSLCHELGWQPKQGSPWDKVVGVFSLNAIDFLTLCWAIHRVGGICLLLHPTSSATEVETHLKASKPSAIFTNHALLKTCLEATKSSGLVPGEKVYILDFPGDAPRNESLCGELPLHSVEKMISEGQSMSSIDPVTWDADEERVAFLCPTSGTSGMQKLAIVTHRGVIANLMQARIHEAASGRSDQKDIALGILPLTHSYGLITQQAMLWRGDTLVLHPRFEMQSTLKSIMQFKINRLYIIPPILAALANNPFLLDMVDLSSVDSIVTGAGGLTKELSEKIGKLRPNWKMLPAYGLTETAVMASFTSTRSIFVGSSGILFPRYRARLIDAEGREVEGYGEPGELLLESPTIFKGYVGDEEATKAAFESPGWLKTGDVAMFRTAPDGTEHLFIVDRLKDMVKVKGLQVASSDIETCLRLHPDVADAAVIGVPHDRDGERAKAFIIRSPATVDKEEEALKKDIAKHVQDNLTEPHWLHRRVEFVTDFPRNQAGKVLKYKLKGL
ncbi:hypothetical protein M406DRAFT_51177 [Cryphonectria parasitica EP155]|uniref:Uncharacterized protein n=1 Tax=Cryphonectria parasitica (strain ATCC 38755 / EP155) TaxID=660469 RepID=A0A9P4XYZ6_CRYP1|nr:uncharacterized protein M406DRAFT_51177 [Cryphonectria parasitica EP155]KAF3763942.1 hypothetical protein M406DRAFT_51177 [Cryphonectria parasitica EP155]